MMRLDFSTSRIWWARRLVVLPLILCATAFAPALAGPQAEGNVSPEATPEIQQVNPNQGAPGAHVKVTIQGRNFSQGAYVSSLGPSLRVESSKRVSATELEAELSISETAQPGTVSLLVSNPASRTAEAPFTIVSGQPPAAPPTPAAPSAPTTPPPTAPAAPPAPSAPPAPPAPAAPPAPSTPPAPAAEIHPSAPATPEVKAPEVTTVDPPRAAAGSDTAVKITGKNFVQGTKVSFANTGIRVLDTTASSSTELAVHITVAPDSATGATRLYVINPDEREVEAPFEVASKAPSAPTTPAAPAAPVVTKSAETQRYAAYHFGNPMEALQAHGKIKGALVVSPGKLRYEEGPKILFDVPLSDIKEIETVTIGGLHLGTFHIILKSGKTYTFAPGSLRPSDSQAIVDGLRRLLPH
jgi:hypothetical protein